MSQPEAPTSANLLRQVQEFIRLESAGGVLLLLATMLAMLLANSPMKFLYDIILDTPVSVQVGTLIVANREQGSQA